MRCYPSCCGVAGVCLTIYFAPLSYGGVKWCGVQLYCRRVRGDMTCRWDVRSACVAQQEDGHFGVGVICTHTKARMVLSWVCVC